MDDYKTDDERMQEMLDAAEWANDLLGHDNAVFLIRRRGQYLGKVSALYLRTYDSHIERHLRLRYGVGVYSVCANVDGAIRDRHREFRIGTYAEQRRADRERERAEEQEAMSVDEESRDDLRTPSETESEKLSRALGKLLDMLAGTAPQRRR